MQSLVYAVGNGVFTAGSAVFFLHVTALTPLQVGLGFSLAGGLSLLLSVPLGALADRFGGRRTWLYGVLAEAALLLCYPLIHGFGPFLALAALAALAESASGTGRAVYQTAILPRESRVRTLAFVRSAMNVGFFAGGTLAAIPLAVGTRAAFILMIVANAAGLFVNAVLIRRLPGGPPPFPQPAGAGLGGPPEPKPQPRTRSVVWRDRPFLTLVALCSVLAGHASLTTEVIPLWLVARTDAPKVTLAVLFAWNTAMCVGLQVLASRGADDAGGIARLFRRAALAVALACAPLYLSGKSTGWLTIVLLLSAATLVTLGELWQSAGYWGVTTELPPVERRGEYVGAARMSFGLQGMVGPAALTFLAMHGGGWGWLGVAGVFVAAGLSAGPVMTWVTRTPRVALMTAGAA